jgi:transcriptional regulator with XRE-family HTH domain
LLTAKFIEGLKRILKSRGVTYRELGGRLGLSEASVKRIFSSRTFTLQRVEDILEAVGANIEDILDLGKIGKRESELSLDQEVALANDETMLLCYYLVARGWKPSTIAKEYRLSNKTIDAALLQLDKLKLIELHQNNRVLLKIGPRIKWRIGGPLSNFFEEKIKSDFLQHRFEGRDHSLYFIPAELSRTSIAMAQKEATKFVRQLNELADIDATLPKQETQSVGILVALRPWVYSEFLKRKN